MYMLPAMAYWCSCHVLLKGFFAILRGLLKQSSVIFLDQVVGFWWLGLCAESCLHIFVEGVLLPVVLGFFPSTEAVGLTGFILSYSKGFVAVHTAICAQVYSIIAQN